MTNLRIISDNAADRAVLSVSSQAGGLGAANLLTDIKGQVWRAAGTSATLTAVWPAGERIGGVHLPFCNLSSGATVRVRGYTWATDAAPVFDTGAVFACPALPLGVWEWGAPLGVNAFAYGGGAHGRVWIEPSHVVQKLVIDIVDVGNAAGYVEAARLVCGYYWSPTHNADYGAPLTVIDRSAQYRNEAGDMMVSRGTQHRKQSLNLSALSAEDRAALYAIARGNGMARPLLLSVCPANADPLLEQAHQMYCRLVTSPAMSTPNYLRYAAQLDFEEI
ncbi:hypothetical protein [Janthinobacterium fluminis]|uniref:Uncharacterized protein n=1 Tax=Janthinobacterium fluminis TaxID=2987524 RepID=A0ABT5JV35_9BURK|nr:hypothetical protein [Janthinobacterium fluminis]MDC8756270.1 hypothetical protein [Janthinobacterium fluminis]